MVRGRTKTRMAMKARERARATATSTSKPRAEGQPRQIVRSRKVHLRLFAQAVDNRLSVVGHQGATACKCRRSAYKLCNQPINHPGHVGVASMEGFVEANRDPRHVLLAHLGRARASKRPCAIATRRAADSGSDGGHGAAVGRPPWLVRCLVVHVEDLVWVEGGGWERCQSA